MKSIIALFFLTLDLSIDNSRVEKVYEVNVKRKGMYAVRYEYYFYSDKLKDVETYIVRNNETVSYNKTECLSDGLCKSFYIEYIYMKRKSNVAVGLSSSDKGDVYINDFDLKIIKIK